jgi:hypothetical protein
MTFCLHRRFVTKWHPVSTDVLVLHSDILSPQRGVRVTGGHPASTDGLVLLRDILSSQTGVRVTAGHPFSTDGLVLQRDILSPQIGVRVTAGLRVFTDRLVLQRDILSPQTGISVTAGHPVSSFRLESSLNEGSGLLEYFGSCLQKETVQHPECLFFRIRPAYSNADWTSQPAGQRTKLKPVAVLC